MLQITKVTISRAAWPVLDRGLRSFAVRTDAPALAYMSRYVEPDGTTVAGFRPGYAFCPYPMDYLSDDCGLIRFPGRRSLYLIPRTGWSEAVHYSVDLVSAELALFSIAPMG